MFFASPSVSESSRIPEAKGKQIRQQEGGSFQPLRLPGNEVDGNDFKTIKQTSQSLLPAAVWRRTMHFALAAARTRHVTAEVFTYKDLALATGNFSKGNVVGEGGFGRVYRAALEGGRVAAVKQLDPKGKQGDKEFRVEVGARCEQALDLERG